MREFIIIATLQGSDPKNHSWFNFNNYGLALGMNLKIYISVANGSKLKVRKGLLPTFVGGLFAPPSSHPEQGYIVFALTRFPYK